MSLTSTEAKKLQNPAREQIMAAAKTLFAEKGLEGTTTRDIANASGLNISLISYYFEGKEGLYRAILVEHMDEMGALGADVFEKLEKVEMTFEVFKMFLTRIIDSILDQRTQNKEIVDIIQREIQSGLPNSREVFESRMNPLVDRIVEVIRLAQGKKVIRADIDPYIFFITLVEGIHGYCRAGSCSSSFISKAPKIPEQRNEYRDQILKIYLEGIRK